MSYINNTLKLIIMSKQQQQQQQQQQQVFVKPQEILFHSLRGLQPVPLERHVYERLGGRSAPMRLLREPHRRRKMLLRCPRAE